MPWTILFLAGVLEIGWAVGLKYTEGWTRLGPSIVTVITMALSMFLLARAVQVIPVGTGYAVWTGIGAVGTAVLGIWLFGESTSPARLLCIAVIVTGIIGLKLTATA